MRARIQAPNTSTPSVQRLTFCSDTSPGSGVCSRPTSSANCCTALASRSGISRQSPLTAAAPLAAIHDTQRSTSQLVRSRDDSIGIARGVLRRGTQHAPVNASIRQSVQNGQFLCRLAQNAPCSECNASDLFIASHADKGNVFSCMYVRSAIIKFSLARLGLGS